MGQRAADDAGGGAAGRIDDGETPSLRHLFHLVEYVFVGTGVAANQGKGDGVGRIGVNIDRVCGYLSASPMTPARRRVTVPPESAGHMGAEDMLMPSPVGAMTGEK